MPPAVADYVIFHELAHLAHPNHSRRFWREVERLCPPWRDAERWLRKHGKEIIETVTSLGDLETFLVGRLRETLPGADAQWRFSPQPTRKGWRPELQPDTARKAAALVLLYPDDDGGALFPLTVRHGDLPQHPGQISLPGGRIDAGETAIEAALREAHEEIGVDTSQVRVVGMLSSLWVVVSNDLLLPVVGVWTRAPISVSRRARWRRSSKCRSRISAIRRASAGRATRAKASSWTIRTSRSAATKSGAQQMVLGEFASLFQLDFKPPEKPPEVQGSDD